ncbi:sperm motility kinase 2B-like [Actinia tenebrosa]|uniref:Sperm motility kinase 2B-like n=1 Tax=Actinia tenebrosa TaxID=6105 RepID=A0A6P8J4Q1_ACTTE|nr:sperm motility kinase 2B-like [Actinia tenebrosa]
MFGSCYLARYRGIKVAVKEYHCHPNTDESHVKKEVLHEASVLSRLGHHRGLPLLLGIGTQIKPYRLIIQFHSEAKKSLTLLKAIKKLSMANEEWLSVMKKVTVAVSRVHEVGFLHNDIKVNNVVLAKRGEGYNPVLVDFGKARTIDSPKSRKILPLPEQRAHLKKYPYFAPEIPRGQGTQSIASDIYSLGYMFIHVKEVMKPTSCREIHLLTFNLKMAVHDIPSRRPSIRSILSVL